MPFFRTIVAALCLCSPLSSHALVNAGNPGGNTTAPTGLDGQPEDPGFANMFVVDGGTAVYLGEGWLLTANHVSAKWIELDGVRVPSEQVVDKVKRVKGADLKLIHLKEALDLPAVKIAAQPPEVGAEVIMIGAGRISEDKLTFWQVDQSTKPWAWTELPDAKGANMAGVLSKGGYQMAWGTNRISAVQGKWLVTDFSPPSSQATPFEAQAISQDSGGAMFAYTDEGWKLIGTMVTVGRLLPDQPGVVKPEKSNTLVVGSGVFGNLTMSLLLPPVRQEIIEITGLGL
ncbi:hypothetical protein H5P28_15185 [Ruficoccus amylovorans]|uniref:Serine protease n=1 Tax=Ruficoccus amylovorans TaxID=1804625 RepID=A0A842HHG1_9BACT|nr:hypothetical protein [Ruficoccus amylovorans]MBC2595610.1 hypothetical protein [Ruficoccus amylovorans]